jgi:ribosomal protein S14
MNYSTTQQQPQQQQPKSARAASKAPLYAQQQQQQQQQQQNRHPSPPTSNASAGTKARQSGGTGGTTHSGPTSAQKGKANANKIWSTSTTEERERIKDFWLGLGEPERRNLVKIEKDTVLRKMKEQQKHSCSCAVCGRKRSVFLVHFSLIRSFFNPPTFFSLTCLFFLS